jgi:hypothetical protein
MKRNSLKIYRLIKNCQEIEIIDKIKFNKSKITKKYDKYKFIFYIIYLFNYLIFKCIQLIRVH